MLTVKVMVLFYVKLIIYRKIKEATFFHKLTSTVHVEPLDIPHLSNAGTPAAAKSPSCVMYKHHVDRGTHASHTTRTTGSPASAAHNVCSCTVS